jgi:hypothetical protein
LSNSAAVWVTGATFSQQCLTEFQRVTSDAAHSGCATYSLLILQL